MLESSLALQWRRRRKAGVEWTTGDGSCGEFNPTMQVKLVLNFAELQGLQVSFRN
jgi:hypothetical protein